MLACGGGGSSKSGVPNRAQLFRNTDLVTEIDFKRELVLDCFPYNCEQSLIVVTIERLYLQSYQDNKFSSVCDLEIRRDPQALAFFEQAVYLAYPDTILVYDIENNALRMREEIPITNNSEKISKLLIYLQD